MGRALWVGSLCVLLSTGCSNGPSAGSSAGSGDGGTGGSSSGGSGGTSSGGSNGAGASGLAGTWDVITSGTDMTTLTIGQDSLMISAPSFTLTATRTGNALAFTDEQTLGDPGDNLVLTGMQTAASFNAGIIPFNLGGSWAMQIVPAGGSTVETCTLTVGSSEIDGSCSEITEGFDFTFTTAKMASAPSSFGDFGGTWLNTWIWPGDSGGTFPCSIVFSGSSITTCPVPDGGVNESPIVGITFAYDGANMVSGAAQGWTEFSATRR
jgi:hypothetical protein